MTMKRPLVLLARGAVLPLVALAASAQAAGPKYDSSSRCFFDVWTTMNKKSFTLVGPNDLTRARPADIRVIKDYKNGEPTFDPDITVTEIKKAVLFEREPRPVCVTPAPGQIPPADGCISEAGFLQEWVIKLTLLSKRNDTPLGMNPPPGGPTWVTTRTLVCTSSLIPGR